MEDASTDSDENDEDGAAHFEQDGAPCGAHLEQDGASSYSNHDNYDDDDDDEFSASSYRMSEELVDNFLNAHALSQVVDYSFKLLLLGDSGAGKTTLLTRFKDGGLTNKMVEITGSIEFRPIVFQVDGKLVKFQIFDSAGQARFRCIAKVHCRNKDAFLVVYDVTNRKTFQNAMSWLPEVVRYTDKAKVFLVANKCDHQCLREVSQAEGKDIANVHDVIYMETSAVSGYNVNALFETVAKTLIAKKMGVEPSDSVFV